MAQKSFMLKLSAAKSYSSVEQGYGRNGLRLIELLEGMPRITDAALERARGGSDEDPDAPHRGLALADSVLAKGQHCDDGNQNRESGERFDEQSRHRSDQDAKHPFEQQHLALHLGESLIDLGKPFVDLRFHPRDGVF